MTQRRWIPGRFVLEDTAGGAGSNPAMAEVVPLLQQWILTKFPDAVPEGLDTLTPENLVEWLKDQVAGAQSDSELGLSGGMTPTQRLEGMRQGKIPMPSALSDSPEGRRRKIAQDIANRRGIPLADALQFVPR